MARRRTPPTPPKLKTRNTETSYEWTLYQKGRPGLRRPFLWPKIRDKKNPTRVSPTWLPKTTKTKHKKWRGSKPRPKGVKNV